MVCVRKITIVFLLVLLLGMLALPAAATAQYQGLEVSIVMDKQSYEPEGLITKSPFSRSMPPDFL